MNIVYLPFTFQDEEFETTDDSMTEEKINDKENSFMSMSMDEKKTQQERQVTKKILMDKVVRNKYIKLKMKVRKFHYKQMHSN